MKPENMILDLSADDPMVQRAMVRLHLRIKQIDAATPFILAARASGLPLDRARKHPQWSRRQS